jgi:hypothetical protein
MIEVVGVGEHPEIGDGLLGFDISCGRVYSLLAYGLNALTKPKDERLFLPGVYTLAKLLEQQFRPLLNEHGLFTSNAIAKECVDAMMALQRIQEDLYENASMTFEVNAVYTVPD